MKISGVLCATISHPASANRDASFSIDIYDNSKALCRVKVSEQNFRKYSEMLGKTVEIECSARAYKDTIYFSEL